MLTVAIYEMAGILPTDPGYGYYRDHVQLFDPGWRGYQSKGPEDWNFAVFDKGNDPEGVLQRYFTPPADALRFEVVTDKCNDKGSVLRWFALHFCCCGNCLFCVGRWQ